jgi:hypothetical protein
VGVTQRTVGLLESNSSTSNALQDEMRLESNVSTDNAGQALEEEAIVVLLILPTANHNQNKHMFRITE